MIFVNALKTMKAANEAPFCCVFILFFLFLGLMVLMVYFLGSRDFGKCWVLGVRILERFGVERLPKILEATPSLEHQHKW